MPKEYIGFRADRRIVLDIEKLTNTKRFNNKTHVIETALNRGLKILKEETFSKF